MEISKTENGKELILAVKGRIDTTNSSELENALLGVENYESLVLDFSELEYISSVGLRIILSTHKKMKGNLKIRHPNEFIQEVFDLTGFTTILNIEE